MVKNGNIAPVRDAPPVAGLELLSAADFRRDARFAALREEAVHWRRLSFHLIVLVTDGASAQCVDFHEYRLQRGDVLLVAPQQLHRFVRLDGWEGWLLVFEPRFLVPNQYIEIQKNTTSSFRDCPRGCIWRRTSCARCRPFSRRLTSTAP